MKRKYLLLALMVLVVGLAGCEGGLIIRPSGPSAPSHLVSIAVSYSEINLTWQDNSDDEEGFRVKCKVKGGEDYYELADLAVNKRYFEHSGLDPLQTYSYYVQAYNETGVANSNVTEATTLSGVNILDYQLGKCSDFVEVVGHGRNTINEMLVRVVFTYWFYDADNILIGSMDHGEWNIPPLTYFEFRTAYGYSGWDRIEDVSVAVTGVYID